MLYLIDVINHVSSVYFMNVPKYLSWHLSYCAPSNSIIYCNRENTAVLLRNWSNFAFVFAWCSTSLCNNLIYDAIDDGEKPCTNFVSALCFFQTDNIIHYGLSIRKISADVPKLHSQCSQISTFTKGHSV